MVSIDGLIPRRQNSSVGESDRLVTCKSSVRVRYLAYFPNSEVAKRKRLEIFLSDTLQGFESLFGFFGGSPNLAVKLKAESSKTKAQRSKLINDVKLNEQSYKG